MEHDAQRMESGHTGDMDGRMVPPFPRKPDGVREIGRSNDQYGTKEKRHYDKDNDNADNRRADAGSFNIAEQSISG